MKLLIFYTPRSKSTMAQEALATKLNLTPIIDPFVYSKLKTQNDLEFANVVDLINDSQDTCVKISSSDFLDSRNRRIRSCYKDIDYNSFDKIIFLSRKDVLAATLSFTYMDPTDKTTWHRKRGETRISKKYSASLPRAHYLVRSYAVYNLIKKHVIDRCKTPIFYEYEFETVEEQLMQDFNLTQNDFDTDVIRNEIDYASLIENYRDLEFVVNNLYNVILQLPSEDIESQTSQFWLYHPYHI